MNVARVVIPISLLGRSCVKLLSTEEYGLRPVGTAVGIGGGGHELNASGGVIA